MRTVSGRTVHRRGERGGRTDYVFIIISISYLQISTSWPGLVTCPSQHGEKTKAMRIAGSGGNESKERDQGLKLFVKDSLRLC